MPDQQSEFWSKVAQKYDHVVDLQIGPGTRSMVRERVVREVPMSSVVEFGCGTGFFTQALVSKADSVLATDLSPGMLDIAKERVKSGNLKFQMEDCQKTSLPDAAFATAFVSLVIHFTDPAKTLAEMRRILKPGGLLLIVNVDPLALSGLDRLRSRIRVIFRGVTGYRVKPPKGLGDNVLTGRELCDLLSQTGFKVLDVETFKSPSSSSSIPVEYIRAVKT